MLTFHVLLIGAFLCLLMALVLSSMWSSRIAGVREWLLANVLGSAAFVLYAFGRELPPLVAYELANATYAAATVAMLVGTRRFFSRPPFARWAMASVVVVAVLVAWFHYVHYSYAARTIVVAVHQSVAAVLILCTIYRSQKTRRSRYPYLFTKTMAALIIIGHVVRSVIYVSNPGEVSSLLQASQWNLFFVSLAILVLPALTLGAVMMMHDTMLARLEDLANRDFLTGAWTRRAFFELAKREFFRARRHGRPIALLLIDVDHFKKINDTFGHGEGDRVLVELALRAQRAIREGIDHFARVGGEEFALLLPETSREDALVVAERLRQSLQKQAAPTGSPAWSVSIGIAVTNSAQSLREVMRHADAALYQAKQSGRNRVVMSKAVDMDLSSAGEQQRQSRQNRQHRPETE